MNSELNGLQEYMKLIENMIVFFVKCDMNFICLTVNKPFISTNIFNIFRCKKYEIPSFTNG